MNSVCFILWIFFAYKKIAPNSYLHTKEFFHWNAQQCKKETTQILWDWNGSKSFCSERCISASRKQELAPTEQPQGWQNVLVGFVGLCAAELACAWAVGSMACAQSDFVNFWSRRIWLQNPLPPEVGFSLSARCPGIMYNTWQQFSWKTTGAYVCDYTYVYAHMHACIDVFIVLCLHI